MGGVKRPAASSKPVGWERKLNVHSAFGRPTASRTSVSSENTDGKWLATAEEGGRDGFVRHRPVGACSLTKARGATREGRGAEPQVHEPPVGAGWGTGKEEFFFSKEETAMGPTVD